MIKVLDRQIIPRAGNQSMLAFSNVEELIADELLLLEVCGSIVVLRTKHEEPIAFTQGLNQGNRMLYGPHARVTAALLLKHKLRDNVTISMDYHEMCSRNTYNVLKCSSAQVVTGGVP